MRRGTTVARSSLLKRRADKYPRDAFAQGQLLKEWLREGDHGKVIERVESGRFATDRAGQSAYQSALDASGRSSSQRYQSAQYQQQQQQQHQQYQQYQEHEYYEPPPRGGSRSSGSSGGGDGVMDVRIVKSKWETIPRFIMSSMLLGAIIYMWNRSPVSSGGGMFQQMRSGTHKLAEEINVTLDDVIGIEEIKEEIDDLVDYLCDPRQALEYGVKMPKGVLLYGPPGVGKTLLAKAMAGESGVPFFYVSASGLEEMFVGVGAMRLRSVFEAAKAASPAVIFIDEIDTIGRKRGQRMVNTGAADQTINQMLALMDGFEENTGVLVVAATNVDPDDLDSALMRSGRFDKKMRVPLPMQKARQQMLEHFLRHVPHRPGDVDTEEVARRTFRLTGADLQNVVNVAAMHAMKARARGVTTEMLMDALQDVRIGPTNRSLMLSRDEIEKTAAHEGGHTIVALYDPDSDDPANLTIVPRGGALGYMTKGGEDRSSVDRRYIMAQIAVALGGKAAEELYYGVDATTAGAASDLQQATELAYNMVAGYGMHDGQLASSATRKPEQLSEATKQRIDETVESLLQERYQYAKRILSQQAVEHRRLVDAILEYETLYGADIKRVCQGREPLFDKS